jgi:quercetin dioxygenase-like cupin family protein
MLRGMNRHALTRWISPLIAGAIAFGPAIARAGTGVPKFAHAIPNLPGKSVVAIEVSFAPGEASRPHHHARSAFIYVYVLAGTIRSQVEGEPARDYRAGDSWFEPPGAHHVQSRNLSATQPAKLLAVFVVDSDDRPLSTEDPEERR